MPLTTQYLTSEYSTIKTKDITKYIHVLFHKRNIKTTFLPFLDSNKDKSETIT